MKNKKLSFPALLSIKSLLPGIIICILISMSSKFISSHYGGPLMLYTLLIGLSLNFLAKNKECSKGIQFSAKTILKLGIVLLGARITLSQIMSYGALPILLVLCSVPLTIIFGIICSKILRLPLSQGILTGTSVGVCGASAALAISTILPEEKNSERQLIFTIISITIFSTFAMICYPLLLSFLSWEESRQGFFLGASIHDVAQVAGSAYMMSENIGDSAIFTKLMRVAMLLPVTVIISLFFFMKKTKKNKKKGSILKQQIFMFGFIFVVFLNSLGVIPEAVQHLMITASKWCLVIAIAGLGIRVSLQEMGKMGFRPFLLIFLETIFLALFCLFFISFGK